jgi:hypothetical protein
MMQRPFFAIDRIASRPTCEFFPAISLPAYLAGKIFSLLAASGKNSQVPDYMDLFAINFDDFAPQTDFFPHFPVWQGKCGRPVSESPGLRPRPEL